MVFRVTSVLTKTVQLISGVCHKVSTCKQVPRVTTCSLRPRIITCRHRNLALPGPVGLPVVGNSHQFDSEQTHRMCTKWSKIYGKMFKFKLLWKKVVVISDPDLLREAFSSETLSKHMNDRSKNSTCHVFNSRRHVGFADLSETTVLLRKILKENVLSKQMKQDISEKCSRLAIANFIDRVEKTDKRLNVDPLIEEYLSDLCAIVVSYTTGHNLSYLRVIFVNHEG